MRSGCRNTFNYTQKVQAPRIIRRVANDHSYLGAPIDLELSNQFDAQGAYPRHSVHFSGVRLTSACHFARRPHLPPHSLTLFIPLVAVDAAIGPTQFQLGTHVKATLAQPHKHYVLACCDAGDVVAYDPRVMHRGTQNQSDRERPVVYLTFSRVWYRDTLNP
eukprot:861074-Pleurochrysis_carterae.AAC.2